MALIRVAGVQPYVSVPSPNASTLSLKVNYVTASSDPQLLAPEFHP